MHKIEPRQLLPLLGGIRAQHYVFRIDIVRFNQNLLKSLSQYPNFSCTDCSMENSDSADKRCEPRRKVLKNGKIVSSDSSTVLDVVIRDISRGGARIKIPASIDIADEFDLIVPADGLRHPCRICWRKGDQLGVQFTAPSRHYAAVKPAFTPDLRQKTDSNALSVSAVLSPTPHSTSSEKAQILSEISLGFISDQLSSDRGTCLVHVQLSNRGKIDAYQPFLCLPSLGLRLVAASGWQMQEVTLVRKMYRFGQVGSAILVAGQSLCCCTIRLPFTTTNGGMLEFEAGNHHAFGALPDLRLTSIVGAGNYPTSRSPLVVSAASMRELFAQLSKTNETPYISGDRQGSAEIVDQKTDTSPRFVRQLLPAQTKA